jgi:RimJ/RimL family protein N-acetyltransferase/GNAT superfamily N-acetyltransferase
MTVIRPILDRELEDFARVAGDEHAAEQRAYATSLLEQGTTRTDWCYVVESDEGLAGRMALWTLPHVNKPLAIVLLDARDDGVAAALLEHAIGVARDAGSETLGSVLDQPAQPPQWQVDPERRHRWFSRAGFAMRRATSRWEHAADVRAPAGSDRLRFRGLLEVGDAAFAAAVERVSTDSLDRYIRSERVRLGSAGEARQLIAGLRELDHQPAWWELAYDKSDALVGLVMPALAPGFGTIGYIGVVPEQRGRGYIHELLARGTTTLFGTGMPILRADTDLDNTPMAAAFERGGWSSTGTRREYEVRLAG